MTTTTTIGMATQHMASPLLVIQLLSRPPSLNTGMRTVVGTTPTEMERTGLRMTNFRMISRVSDTWGDTFSISSTAHKTLLHASETLRC